MPVYGAMPLADYIGGPLQSQQTATQLLALLAAVSSLLAAIGLYGVIAYAVAQRTKEIGVRIALGAQTADVLRVVASEARGLLVSGLIIGLIAGFGVSRAASSMLYSVSGADTMVFAAAGGIMIVVALIAMAVPTRRAMRIDPLTALRAD